mmetsp:Transcript_56600/g.150955  ORF Transcript_56600/g.150955 Transcript_56600/m.150955 type:complete len:235 (+) Transcript_56600:1143-1847(+)
MHDLLGPHLLQHLGRGHLFGQDTNLLSRKLHLSGYTSESLQLLAQVRWLREASEHDGELLGLRGIQDDTAGHSCWGHLELRCARRHLLKIGNQRLQVERLLNHLGPHRGLLVEVGSETQGAPEHRAQPAPPGCRGDGFAAWSAGPEAWGRAGRRTLAGWRQRGRPLACRHGRSCTTFRRWRRGALPHRPAGTDLGRRRRRGLPQHHPPDACGRWGRRGVPHWHPAAAPRRRRRR